jgi:hypothetical protein
MLKLLRGRDYIDYVGGFARILAIQSCGKKKQG